jgi:hypothetical protein
MAENPFLPQNPFLTPGALLKGEDDGPLTRGFANMSSSVRSAGSLLKGDHAEVARLADERAAYRRANPGSPEGNELMAAWEAGDGIAGGASNVAGEIAKDWREAPGVVAGARATGKNLAAIGAGVLEQVPNMLPPMTGLLAGGATGAAAAGPAGAVVGGWAGASAGNTAVEAGEQIDRALQKAGIDPRDRVATEAFLKENGDRILGQAGTKGAIIGAVDVATLGAGHALLTAPAKAAAGRALKEMGIDMADKGAVKAAAGSAEFKARLAADTALQAAQKGAPALARNATVAGLEPAGEFAGEYLGQGVATDDWDTKGAALEAAMSLGQGGITFAGQKLYQAATRPGRGGKPGDLETLQQGEIAASDAANAELAAAGDLYAAQAPGTAGLLPEKPIVTQNPTTGRIVELDRRGGPLERAAAGSVEAGVTDTMQRDDASPLLFPYANRRAAREYVDAQADPELYDVEPHPSVKGRFAALPKTGRAKEEILSRRAEQLRTQTEKAAVAAANEASKARTEQLAEEEEGAGGAPAVKPAAKKPAPVAKPAPDTTADDAQDELAPPPVQPMASMPAAQQRATAQARAANEASKARTEQLAEEEAPKTIDADAARANVKPTDGQKDAGNFAKGHIRVGGIDIAIENPVGSERTGVEAGKRWKTKLKAHYGYVKRTTGADGDQVDVYVKQGTAPEHDGPVFVVDQYNPGTGDFDETKSFIGYGSQAEAQAAYDAHFGDKSGPKRRGAITQMSAEEFRTWTRKGDTTKPVSSTKFKGQTSDPEQAAQEEIAQSIGLKMSRRRDKESPEAYQTRMAAEANQRRSARVEKQAQPTRENDQKTVSGIVRGIEGVAPEVKVSILSAATRPNAGQAKGVSKQAAQFIEQVARVFKKRVVFFDTDSPAAASDGFYLQGNTIYLGVNSSVAHLRVLGHELTHAMKAQAGDAYDKMLGAVSGLLTEQELRAQHKDYFGTELDTEQLDLAYSGEHTLREFLAEEWIADLSGNRFAEAGFWSDVFAQLEAQHGDTAAKGIVARLRLALVKALNKLLALVKGNAFAVDARLADNLEEIRKAIATGFAEYGRRAKADQLTDTAAGEVKFAEAPKETLRKGEETPARLFFEVAPDPRNTLLKTAWDQLPPKEQTAISKTLSERVIPKVFAAIGAQGHTEAQLGGWMGDTSPSFALVLEHGDAGRAARAIGHVLSQEAMYVMSLKPFDGGSKSGILEIDVGAQATPAEIHAVYQKVRALSPETINGHSTIGGVMHIGAPLEWFDNLGVRVNDLLGDKYHVGVREGYSAEINEKDYSYASDRRGLTEQRLREGRIVDSAKVEAEQLFRAELADRGIRFSPARPDAAGDRLDRGNGAPGLRRKVQPESVSAEGVHYSRAQRSRVDSSYFGTGIKGAEVQRVQDASDPRIKQRIYFYVNSGRGIKPEEGVGSHAHRAQLDNLYDYVADPLDLRSTNTFSGFESAVLDKGFDGYVTHEHGIAVLLGKRSLEVEYLGRNSSPEAALAGKAEPSTFGQQLRAVAANNALPAGEMTGAEWKKTMATAMPELDVSHLDDAGRYYKNEIVKRPKKFSPARQLYEWKSQTTSPRGPVYHGDGFSLEAVRKHATGGDFEIENGLPWGHAAFVEDEAYRFAVLDAQGRSVGFIDAEVNGLDEISAIHDMAIGLPGTGLGTRIVETVLASTYDGLRVIDVLPQSEKFWDRLGAGTYDINHNTRLDFEGSPAATRYRLERGGRVRAAEEGPQQARTGRQEVRHSTARDELPTPSAPARTLHGAELIALRRAAAGLERPQSGIFLRVTGDGRAIATGPKGARIPDTFRRFAADHRLSFFAGRSAHSDLTDKPGHYSTISIKSEPMPVNYRQSGALYFGESGAVTLDRTERTRFSLGRQRDLFPEEFAGKDAFLETEVVTDSRGGTTLTRQGNLNSEGRAITHSMGGLRNFWNWFGESEAVTEDGRPLVLYHNTAGDFSEFETLRESTNTGLFGVPFNTRRAGIFLAQDQEFAADFAKGAPGENSMRLYARIEAPADFSEGISETLEKALGAQGVNVRALNNLQYWWEAFEEEYGGVELVAALKAAGYDGAIITEEDAAGESKKVYVAFESAQLKSVTGNLGVFDGSNPDIRYSLKRVAPEKLSRVELSEFGWYEQPDDYVYHVTSAPAADKALKSGLLPGQRSLFPESYASHVKGRVFFTERDGVKFWEERVENALFDRYDDPPEVAVLRVAKADVQLTPDEVGTRDARHGASFVQFSPARLSQEFEAKLQMHFKTKQPQPIKLADNTPASLQLFGWNDLPVIVSPNVVDKMHFDHGMTVPQMARLPYLLKRPLMIFADGENMSLVFVGEHLAPGKIALVAIKPDIVPPNPVDRQPSNMIVTGYAPQNGWAEVTKRVSRGELVYRDTLGEIPDIVRGALAAAQKKYAQFGRGLPRELLQGSTPPTYGDSSRKAQSGTRSPTVSTTPSVLGRNYNVLGQSALVKLENDTWPDGAKFSHNRAQTETAEFRAWFGDSLVIDENGQPRVVYHGTNKDFMSFDAAARSSKTGNPNAQLGFFFSERPEEASRYAKDWGRQNGNVMPVYLAIRNPYVMGYTEFNDLAMAAYRSLQADPAHDPDATVAFGDLEGQRAAAARLAEHEAIAQKQAAERREELIREGYDGIVVRSKAGDEYIAFEPAQIKSAVGNNGVFSAGDPDIRFSRVRKIGDTTVIENPTREQARTLLARSDYQELRGIQVPETGKLWVWDSNRLLHKQAATELGFSEEEFLQLMLKSDGHGKGLLLIRDLGEGAYPYPIFSGERQTAATFSPSRAQTPEFKAWYEGSNLFDESGEPMVLYHGTNQDLKKFQASKTGMTGAGVYLGESPDVANAYAEGPGANVMPVYARGRYIGLGRWSKYVQDHVTWEKARAAAEADGVAGIWDQQFESAINVFDPSNIKSAVGNSGAFSADDTDIRFSPARSALGTLTTAQALAANNVLGTPKTLLERLTEFKTHWAKNLKQGIFDQFAPIAELDQGAYIQARLSKGGDSTLEALMLYGKLSVGADGATDVQYTRAGGPQGFASKMAALKGEQERFMLWVAAQRADRLKGIGLENLWSAGDIAALKTLNAGNMKDGTPRLAIYAQAMRDLNDFNDNVLEVAVASGLIDDSTRQLYKDTPYVPFYRLNEDDEAAGFNVKPGLVNQYAWKRLKGGTDKLNEDLTANLLQNWSHLITASAKNRAAKATLTAAERAGVAAEIPAGTPGKGHVSYKDAGREKVFIVADPHLMDAIAALEYSGPGPWAKPFAAAKHWLTIGVTTNPAFKIRNLIRDSISAIGTSGLSYNPVRNIKQGWAASGKDSETRAHMLAAGGMIRFGSMLDGKNSQRAQDLINEGVDPDMILDSDKKIKRFYKRYLHPALSAYNELGDRSEQTNRAALYEQMKAKGMSHAEAAFWARDLMDFSMGGKWTAIRTITQTVPFFNARLQGLYKLGRAGKQDIRRLGYVLGAVSLASLALLLAYEDDEDWRRRSDADRNNYWWFKVGGVAVRVPKPFEIGAVGTLAERGYELMFNPEMTGKRFGKNMSDIVMSQLAMNPTPQLFKPMMDLYANRDSFTGRDIESMGMELLRKADRYDERTSELARFLGGLGLPDPTQLIMGRVDTISPKQFDFLARAYFSWLGTMTTTVLDYGIRPAINRGDRPDRQLRDVFLVGNFVESLPSNSSRYVQQMYDQAREIEQAYASYRSRLKLGDIEGAREILADERETILRRPAATNLVRAESLINVQIRRTEANAELNGAEKRERLDALYARRNQLAENFRAQ